MNFSEEASVRSSAVYTTYRWQNGREERRSLSEGEALVLRLVAEEVLERKCAPQTDTAKGFEYEVQGRFESMIYDFLFRKRSFLNRNVTETVQFRLEMSNGMVIATTLLRSASGVKGVPFTEVSYPRHRKAGFSRGTRTNGVPIPGLWHRLVHGC